VQKICMLVLFGSFETPQINICITMLKYHCAFRSKDERLEDPILNKL